MSTPFVSFPGTSGNYLSTASDNLADADTAHMFQSKGAWGELNSLTAVQLDDASVFGGKYWRAERTGGTGTVEWRGGSASLDTIPVLASTQYWFSLKFRKSAALDVQIIVRSYDSGAGLLDSAIPVTDSDAPSSELKTLSGTFTTPANAVRIRIDVRQQNAPEGSQLDIGEFCYRTSDGPFVPSVRIVSDLDIRTRCAADDWALGGGANGFQYVIGTLSGSLLGSDGGFHLSISDVAAVTISYTDGSGLRSEQSALYTLVNGQPAEIRVTWDVSANLVRYYQNNVEIDTDATPPGPGVGGKADLYVGTFDGVGIRMFKGSVWWAEVRDGIDGPVVARMDAADAARATVL